MELWGEIYSQRRYHCPHGPADSEPPADSIGIQHRGDGRHDEIAEHQKDACNSDRGGYDETEGSVKEKIPDFNRDSFGFGLLRIQRNRQKLAPEDIVEYPDHAVENGCFTDFRPRYRQNVADEHVLEVLALGSRFAHREDGGRRRHGVANTDHRFLGNTRVPGTYH